ncbi:MAG: hypothetical protein HPY75_08095 [Actinobacteria bacterium]|nr:hypothetical protein [Actinomycetota bacterium]
MGLSPHPLGQAHLGAQRLDPDKTVHRFSHGRLSVISAITVSPARKHLSLYFKLSRKDIRADGAAGFLCGLLRAVPGHLIVTWDNSNTHRAKVVKDLERSRPRLHLECLPPYAPELNPDEGV